jgi:hypothetical protein
VTGSEIGDLWRISVLGYRSLVGKQACSRIFRTIHVSCSDVVGWGGLVSVVPGG